MTNKAELYALAGKVEKLEGGCRETDAEIAIALGLVPSRFTLYKGSGRWTNDNGRRSVTFKAEIVTSSIDAAMTLVPEGFYWTKNLLGKTVYCVMWDGGCEGEFYRGKNASEANAITAASLRAIGGE